MCLYTSTDTPAESAIRVWVLDTLRHNYASIAFTATPRATIPLVPCRYLLYRWQWACAPGWLRPSKIVHGICIQCWATSHDRTSQVWCLASRLACSTWLKITTVGDVDPTIVHRWHHARSQGNASRELFLGLTGFRDAASYASHTHMTGGTLPR